MNALCRKGWRLAVGLLVFSAFAPADSAESKRFSDRFLDSIAVDAKRFGISPRLWKETRAYLQKEGISQEVIDRDRRQPEIVESLYRYLERRLDADRVRTGQRKLAGHRKLLHALEQRYGVPGEILVAIWGVESNYGKITGRFSVLRSTATLSAEGRRAKFFRQQFVTALAIVQRESLRPESLLGSWAGAMGHVQFIPTTYWHYGRDGDGDGKINVWSNLADTLTSAAYYLKRSGWRRDLPWGLEVVLPPKFDFSVTGMDRWRSKAFWRKRGVRAAYGSQSPRLEAIDKGILLLPSGVEGPAFLLSKNFRALLRWNYSSVYALSVGHLSDRIIKQPPLRHNPPEESGFLSTKQVRFLQRKLNALGFRAGPEDGMLGTKTRSALMRFQKQRGFVADGFPSRKILAELKRR